MRSKGVSIKLRGKGGVRAFAISNDNKLLAVTQHGLKKGDAILSVLDMNTFETIKVLEQFDENSLYGLAFTAKDNYLLYSKDDYLIHVVDTKKMEAVNAIETSNNRKIIASASYDKIICLGRYLEVWEVAAENRLFRMADYEAFKITEAGEIPATVSWNDKAPGVSSFVTEPPVACFSAKKDNRVYYAGVNKPVISSLDINTGKTKVLINDGVLQAGEIKVSSGDKYVAVSSRLPQGKFVWDTNTGKRVAASLINDRNGSAAPLDFHPGAPLLAWGSAVGFLTVIDLEKEDVYYSEKIHDANINQVQFIEHGSRIITAANDGKLIITDLPL